MNATAIEIHEILSKHSLDVISQLGVMVNDVQLYLPLDGNPRIKVSIRPSKIASYKLPSELDVNLDGKQLKIKLEICDDFQDYGLQ